MGVSAPTRRQIPRLAALALLTSLYGLARGPAPVPDDERRALAARFGFTAVELAIPGDLPVQSVRRVHPGLQRLQSWVASLGASIALTDFDADGLANDICLVDPRVDRVLIMPAPATGERYSSFALPRASDEAFVAPTGCTPGDLNEDGLTDVLVVYWGRTPVAFLRRADRTALDTDAFVPVDVAPGGEIWNTDTATLADLDGDGHLDIAVANQFPDGMRPLDSTGSGLAYMFNSFSRAANGGRNRLLRWVSATSGSRPDVHFTDVSDALEGGWPEAWTHAVAAGDLDGDGLPELFFANDIAPDALLHNRSRPGRVSFVPVIGARGWLDPASHVLGRDSFKGMGVDFADLNGDAIPDIFVSNIAIPRVALEAHHLWLSTGDRKAFGEGRAPYRDLSDRLGLARSGWAWDVKFADFDNDGALEAVQATGMVRGRVNRWPELQELSIANDELVSLPQFWPRLQPGDELSGHEPNTFYVMGRDGRFVDLQRELGLEPERQPYVTRGIAIADVDGDGDLDFAIANQWEPSIFYRNDAPARHAFLGLRLWLPVTAGDGGAAVAPRPGGRPAVGATVSVRTPDGRRWTAAVDGGNGHAGKRSQAVHIGLGPLAGGTLLDVEVHWRQDGLLHTMRFQRPPGWHDVMLRPSAPGSTPASGVER